MTTPYTKEEVERIRFAFPKMYASDAEERRRWLATVDALVASRDRLKALLGEARLNIPRLSAAGQDNTALLARIDDALGGGK